MAKNALPADVIGVPFQPVSYLLTDIGQGLEGWETFTAKDGGTIIFGTHCRTKELGLWKRGKDGNIEPLSSIRESDGKYSIETGGPAFETLEDAAAGLLHRAQEIGAATEGVSSAIARMRDLNTKLAALLDRPNVNITSDLVVFEQIGRETALLVRRPLGALKTASHGLSSARHIGLAEVCVDLQDSDISYTIKRRLHYGKVATYRTERNKPGGKRAVYSQQFGVVYRRLLKRILDESADSSLSAHQRISLREFVKTETSRAGHARHAVEVFLESPRYTSA